MIQMIGNIDFWALCDILIVWIILYQFAKLIHGTRAEQIVIGIVILAAGFFLSSIAPLSTLHWFLNKFYASILIIVIILFQDEIKSALSKLGKNPLFFGDKTYSINILKSHFDEILRAVGVLAKDNTGALIVLEKNIILNRYVEVGVKIDSEISHQLICSIFNPASPIHDGAVVIKDQKIFVAGCFLPLSQSNKLALHMGTRHRAALGISEQTDAVVVLVSEERGSINLIYDGHIENDLTIEQLRNRLYVHFADDIGRSGVNSSFRKRLFDSSTEIFRSSSSSSSLQSKPSKLEKYDDYL